MPSVLTRPSTRRVEMPPGLSDVTPRTATDLKPGPSYVNIVRSRMAPKAEAFMAESSDVRSFPDKYVQVGQISTRFWEAGDQGPTVVLVHGLGGSVEQWSSNIGALSEHCHVVALDLVGAGRSDKPAASYSVATLAHFLNDFLETQGLERTSLIGSSLGGAVSLHFAIRFPEKLDRLVLASSAGLGREVALAIRLCTLPLVGEWLTRPSREGTARLLKLYFRDPAIVTDEIVDMSFALAALPGAQKAWLSMVRDNSTLRGVRVDLLRFALDNLRNITAPTLIVWGREDRIFPVAHAYDAERGIPNARLVVFDSCGHLPMVECAAAFNAVVSEFLR